MNPRTKYHVKHARWMQVFLRICALLGAAGMLVCVICIKGTDGSVAWIIRIPVSTLLDSTVLVLMEMLLACCRYLAYCIRHLPSRSII